MPVYTLDYLADNQPKSVPSIIGDGLLPENGILLVVAPTSRGKSAIVLDICFSLALQEPLFNAYRKKNDGSKGKPYFPVHSPCRVLYIDAEMGQAIMHDRVRTVRDLRAPGVEFGSRFQIVTGHAAPLLVHPLIHDDQPYKNLKQIIIDAAPEPESDMKYVVILDPLADFHQVDEDDNMMRVVFQNIRALQNEIGFSVIIPHHESDKPLMTQSGPIARRGTGRSRGHSSIAATVGSMLAIEAGDFENSRGFMKLVWEKTRGASKPVPGWIWADLNRMYFQWIGPAKGTTETEKLRFKTDYLAAHPLKDEE